MILRYSLRRLLLPVALSLAGLTFFVAPVQNVSALPASNVVAVSTQCQHITSSNNKNADTGEGQTCIFEDYINPLVKFLAALAGLAVIVSVIWGGIMYQTSGGDSGKVAKAKGHIYQAFVALFAFLFLVAFLEWILPGGISGSGS